MIHHQTALITGGSQGIGAAIASALLDLGLNVAVTGRDVAKLSSLEKQLNTSGNKPLLCIEADVRDRHEMDRVVTTCNEKFGTIGIVIANAGVGSFVSIDEMSYELWHQTIDTNLTGVFNTLKSTLEDLKISQGYFITMASLAGTNFFETASAYNASKFGLVGFSQAVMLDLRKFGIKVTTIMPGSVATHFNNHIPDAKDAWKIQPEDIAQIVVDLLKMPARTLPSKIEVRPSFPSK
jgi:NADP-dependent 3-hydroxy acid dehydrogenase YdfG